VILCTNSKYNSRYRLIKFRFFLLLDNTSTLCLVILGDLAGIESQFYNLLDKTCLISSEIVI